LTFPFWLRGVTREEEKKNDQRFSFRDNRDEMFTIDGALVGGCNGYIVNDGGTDLEMAAHDRRIMMEK
jgi:hypothetical protein